MNIVWFVDENRKNTLVKGRIAVTNDNLFNKAIAELKDINKYKFKSNTIERLDLISCPSPSIQYSNTGALVYDNIDDSHCRVSTYDNLRSLVYRLLLNISLDYYDNIEENIELMDFIVPFLGFTNDDSNKARETEFNFLCSLVNDFENGVINTSSIKDLFCHIQPNFGFYATYGMDCTKLEHIDEYNLEELKLMKSICERHNFNLDKKVDDILKFESLANKNTKVLSLAKRINNLSCDK